MKLIYVFHSGFVIEAADFAILIDYYKDTGFHPHHGYVHDELLKRESPLYILSSHAHPDHFNKEILAWKKKKENITYIFSRDILHHRKAGEEEAVYLLKGESYEDEKLSIKAFGSTDAGISFLIRAEGKEIFHAGDLNNWHWKAESTPEEIAVMERDYLNEVALLQQTTTHLDLAMFPVDPRLGDDYALGAEQFIDRIHVDLFAPMHFAESYQALPSFCHYAREKETPCVCWKEKGQFVEF
ncbi:L-ascorbate metabolism protein UlaG (beta-lactamase superfamily) [Parabacteroides sp. PFB2-10]|uniref:MBL fold metallo-hydrolase n=1 Tax=Parabacteroides sp. PFB2-10 TaxID=1742405 RepID=UPI0024764BE1|nr:MBL fold metallo-hydrolase [Parabacteroides sp. PFB2-10]MDH6312925.1 L-ascorbate metabolism protein UlaG (beta-lactamase superfamily) [Parabacteroides sp. PFB2-10]